MIALERVTKKFGDNTVLKELNLNIKANEFLTLLGPSGCGKTTTLRLIAGFEQPTDGRILFEGKDITKLPPNLRNVNTVFQKYALFPHMNVFENIAFGLRIKKISEEIIREKVSRMLRLVNLEGYEKRSVRKLSGGQQQRVAIVRALVNEPKVLLLDEPLGALDLKLRKDMQVELKSIKEQVGITFVYVTHDQEEALTMSDTVVVLNHGLVQQIGSPTDIYNEPINSFVADFIGESNIVPAVMREDFLVEFAGMKHECEDRDFSKDEEVEVVIRPEDMDVVDFSSADFKAVVKTILFKGVHYEMVIEGQGREWLVHSYDSYNPGSEIGIRVIPFNIHVMRKQEMQ